MMRGQPVDMDLAQRADLFQHALGFQGLSQEQIAQIAGLAFGRRFAKGEIIFEPNLPCRFFYLVARGLAKVYICSPSGMRLTYLLANRGEPLNLIGPFTGTPRFLSAEAMEEAVVAHVRRQDFLRFASQHPAVVVNIISILGRAIDSANSRIVDLVEKRVEQRLVRVLFTLLAKFGTEINLTSSELAELAGTTTESTLRTMARLRRLGIIASGRGQVKIIQPASLKKLHSDPLWV
ncbi:MAG: Crp/Fnr family transcriptional regulator [Desulfarculus sp.]|nr:MAG: Crp/Fnr family transcriptional regulator [Desulfarculus sp.]